MTQNSQLQHSAKDWKPHDYQKEAVKFLVSNMSAGLFLDPGLGKTSIVLAAFKLLKKKKLADILIVIAPLRPAYMVWPNEIDKWTDFEDLRYAIVHGPNKTFMAAQDADVYILNYDGIDWAAKTGQFLKWTKGRHVTVVFDELSKLKHTTTARFKKLKPFLPKFARRWGLTGTPATNGLMGLFGQCYALDMGRTLGPYITHFRMQYFAQTGFGGYEWVLRPGCAEAIYERIRPLVLRMDAEDYLQLPELTYNDIIVDLPPSAMSLYKDMEEKEFAMLDASRITTAANAAAATNKCRQIANGGVYVDGQISDDFSLPVERETHVVHNAKTEALVDLIEELQGEPLLVAYEFRHDLERIQKALGVDIPFIGGGTSPKLAKKYEQEWNAGELPVLVGHPQSIGHGVNLQGSDAHNICWYGLTWDLELWEQFIARLRRQGNNAKRIIVHRIIARDTIDHRIVRMLDKKGKVQDALLDALK